MGKALVVYDSVFGNTRQVAIAISEGLLENREGVVRSVSEVTGVDQVGMEILVVGSPTRGFRATPASMAWINGLPANVLANVKTAAFDTRIPEEKIKKNWFLRLLGPMVKYAVAPIAQALKSKGAAEEVRKNWFYVADSEGPLLENELERARKWGQELAG